MAVNNSTETIGRREVARRLGLTHQDSVSRLLGDGLLYAVVTRGGRGKLMRFDRGRVERWRLARECRRVGGGPCPTCALILEDAAAVAEHLATARHAAGGCQECRATWGLAEPCAGAR